MHEPLTYASRQAAEGMVRSKGKLTPVARRGAPAFADMPM